MQFDRDLVEFGYVPRVPVCGGGVVLGSTLNPFFGPHCMALVGWLFPDQGSNLCSLQWKHGVLTTGLPRNSNFLYL